MQKVPRARLPVAEIKVGDQFQTGPDVTFANTTPYSSYRVLFTGTRPASTGVTFPGTGYQLSEVAIGVPEPASVALLGLGSLGLLARRRRRAA